MSLSQGARFGPYEIVTIIGAGGMGEVYRARDTSLHRDVAIKVLPELVAADPERLARFEREAHTLAALNHPNIAQIYGLEGAALVMELVEGDDLAVRITRGAIPTEEALAMARQVADALQAAHDHGIIHRDLKPANIKVRSDGTVKVLDFGLAKATGSDVAAASPVNFPTITSPAAMTQAGIILGTAAYMAPEQARGHAVDRRVDIWAFGCVLYEMLTGRRAFAGDNITDTLAAIVRADPEWTALPPDTPPAIRRLLRRCLEKDRKRRLADISDARLEIDDAFGPNADAAHTAPPPTSTHARFLPLVATGLICALVAGTLMWFATRPTPIVAPDVVRLQAALPPQAVLTVNPVGQDVAVSPDGSRLAYIAQLTPAAQPQLFVRTIDRGDTAPLKGTEQPSSPFFSPDGETIAYAQSNNLMKVSVRGGTPVTICRACAAGLYGGTWGTDGTIIFAPAGGARGFQRIGQDGQAAKELTSIDRANGESRHGFPEMLPGGRALLFALHRLGDVPPDVAVLDLKTGTRRVLVSGGNNPRYVSPGFIVFSTIGALRAVPFDLTRLEVTGNPAPVVDHVITKSIGGAQYAVSDNGTLVYVSGDALTPIDTIAWVGRDGREETIRVPPHDYVMARVAPDGRHVVLDSRDQDFDLWLWSFTARTLTRLTFDPQNDQYPVWTRDGRHIIRASFAGGTPGLFRMDLAGSNERLTSGTSGMLPTTISPDGKWVIVNGSGTANAGLTMISTEAGHEQRPLVGTAAGGINADISPDGRWIAYQSSASGRSEVYVHPFPDTASMRRQLTTDQGTQPLWAPNGRELVYLDAGRRLMGVPVETKPTFSAGNPTMILDRVRVVTPGRSYDISPDSQRFLVIKEPASAAQAGSIRHLDVVLNWTEELKRLARPSK
jgi:serine/threonine protein kinase